MKGLQKLVNERYAKSAAQFMKFACYFIILFLLLCLALSFMGRQTFRLQTSTGTYDSAIYAEENHNPASRSFTVSMDDSIFVHANEDDQIDLATQVALSLMFAFHTVPLIFAYWLLSRVFANINEGLIFSEQNAFYLLYYGLIQLFVALFVPFIKLLICYIFNLISSSQITISTGSNILNHVVPSIAFIVAAYIIHYGIHLQDEVDHTI